MKKQSLYAILSLTVSASLFAFSAHAGDSKPCQEIRTACEAGGFVKGGHKKDGKGLMIDCMKKIIAGESVPGVTVSPEQVSACKAKKEKRAKK